MIEIDGQLVTVSQPDGYETNFKPGDNVVYRSTLPLNEGGNVMFIAMQ